MKNQETRAIRAIRAIKAIRVSGKKRAFFGNQESKGNHGKQRDEVYQGHQVHLGNKVNQGYQGFNGNQGNQGIQGTTSYHGNQGTQDHQGSQCITYLHFVKWP